MSLPRPIVAGELYLITRRTAGRRFFLKPSEELNKKVEYSLAVAAERHGIQVHAITVLSNHYHAVCSDPLATMPAFLRDAHSWSARSLNSSIGRWENLWASEQTSLVKAKGAANVLGRIVYTLANPVAAGLVAHGKSWPGLRAHWPQKRPAVARPAFFDASGTMPAEATLELHRPPGFDGMDDARVETIIRTETERREAFWRFVFQRQGRRFLGRRAVVEQSSFNSPRSRAPRRNMSPRVAEKNKWRRIEALQRLRTFLDHYRAALATFRAGFRDVVFPAGTYQLRVETGVTCADC